jgi:hypothetical protein
MADSTSGGNWPRELEEGEVEKDGKKDDSLKAKFLKEFAEEKKNSKNKEKFGPFINGIFSTNTFSNDIRKDLIDFKKDWVNDDEDITEKNKRNAFDLSEVSFDELKNQFKPDYITFQQNSEALFKLFDRDFLLNGDEKEKLKEKFNTLPKDDFYIYVRSFTERKKFLEKNGIRDVVDFKDMPKIFLDLVKEDDFKKRQDDFSEADKIIFNKFLKKSESWKVSFDKLEEGDIYDFFMRILRPAERIKFLKEYFPYISFWDLKRLEILDGEKLSKIKKGVLKEYLSQIEGKLTISDNDLDAFLLWKWW